jgi:hypothetical protein
MSVTFIKITDPQQFTALLRVMGKSYQYRKFIEWCTSLRLNQVACSYWSNPKQKMAVSVEVVYRKSGWKLVSADFAIADKWTESRKAVVELNNLVEARYPGSQWIKKDLSRKKKAVSASK